MSAIELGKSGVNFGEGGHIHMLLASVPQLDRVAIQLGPFPVYWYGIIIGTGVLLGLWLATREGERLGIPKDTFVDLVLIAVPIAILFCENVLCYF